MTHIADRAAIRPRPHHYMNADGTCHAGDAFDAGSEFVVVYAADELVRIVNHEKAEAWNEATASAYLHETEHHVGIRHDPNPYAVQLES